MVPVGDHASLPAGQAIQPPGDPHPEPLHCAPERDLVVRLHEQMKMVTLHREVDDARAQPLARRAQRLPDDWVDTESAQLAHAAEESRRLTCTG